MFDTDESVPWAKSSVAHLQVARFEQSRDQEPKAPFGLSDRIL